MTFEDDVALGCALAHHLHAIGDDIGEIDAADIERHAAGLDLRHVENVVDDFEQIVAACQDIAGVFLVLGMAERAEQRLLHHLGEADDGVERRAQLVADIGEELGFGAIGRFGPILLQRVFLGEIDQLLFLLLELAARELEFGDARPELLFAVGETIAGSASRR